MNISFFNTVLFRRIKDYLHFLKDPFVGMTALPRNFKRLLSQLLRRHKGIQKYLNLPAPDDQEFLAWIDSNTVGDQWFEMKPAEKTFHSQPFSNQPRNYWYFEKYSHSDTDIAGIAILHDGYVHAHHGGQFLNCKGEYLWDMGREDWRYFGGFFMDSVLKLPKPIKLTGTVAVISHEYAYNNFSHWVFDILPKISLLQESNYIDVCDWFLVGHSRKKYQLDSLRVLGIPDNKIIQLAPGAHYQAQKIVLPRLCGYNQQYQPAWKIKFLKEEFGHSLALKSNRKLFISRSDASFRRLVGEDDLFDLLSQIGFEKVTLSGFSLKETVRLFAEAQAVVGPFGSGLMNIAFCAPNTKVVEIAIPEFYNCYHWYLSGTCGLDHAVYFGNSSILPTDKPPNQLTKDIHINALDCYEFLQRFLAMPTTN